MANAPSSPSAAASPRASAAPRVTASASTSAGPTTAVPPYDLVGPWQTARVVVNGLAVRSGPSTSDPLIEAYRWDDATDTEVQATDDVRLADGHYVFIELGPIVINGAPWYLVNNSDRQDEAHVAAGELRWDADGDEFRFDSGWVAGGDATNPWIVADELPPLAPGTPVYGDAPDPYALAHDIGSQRTTSFVLDAPVGIRWAAAAPDGGTCRIVMTLEPLGLEMLATDITGWRIGDDYWPRDYDFQEPLPSGDHWIEVETDCSWSLRVMRIIG